MLHLIHDTSYKSLKKLEVVDWFAIRNVVYFPSLCTRYTCNINSVSSVCNTQESLQQENWVSSVSLLPSGVLELDCQYEGTPPC